jgi:cardiolipin synthase A/B
MMSLYLVLFSLLLGPLSYAEPSDYCSAPGTIQVPSPRNPIFFSKIKSTVSHVNKYLKAEHWMQKKMPYETWDHMADRLIDQVLNTSSFSPRMAGEPSLLLDEKFRAELAGLLNNPFESQWLPGNHVEILVNGEESFKKRKELLDAAQESIYIFVWTLQDDETGWEFAQWLIDAKLKRLCEGKNLDIKIVVDGNVAKDPGYHGVLNFLVKIPAFAKNPIQVVRLNDKKDPYFGMHRKVILFDRRQMIMGGINIGNKYSHLFPNKEGKWRDNDVYVTGPVVNQAQQAFVAGWNEQRGRAELTYMPAGFDSTQGGVLSMIVDHQPLRDDNILLATIKAFYGATHTIDIENDFFVLDPVVERALFDALNRGIRVRILANSAETEKHSVLEIPALKNLAKLKARGAEVYLKKIYNDSTHLHSKVLIVDDVLLWIGSHNFHPRSERYEREIVLLSLDESLATQFEDIFENDIAPDHAINPTLDELQSVKSGKLNKWVTRKFFDQL